MSLGCSRCWWWGSIWSWRGHLPMRDRKITRGARVDLGSDALHSFCLTAGEHVFLMAKKEFTATQQCPVAFNLKMGGIRSEFLESKPAAHLLLLLLLSLKTMSNPFISRPSGNLLGIDFWMSRNQRLSSSSPPFILTEEKRHDIIVQLTFSHCHFAVN